MILRPVKSEIDKFLITRRFRSEAAFSYLPQKVNHEFWQ